MKYDAICRSTARRYAPLARNTCGIILGEDDLYMEALIAVHEALATYKHDAVPEEIWVRTRIRQRLIDVIRKFNVRTRGEIKAIQADSDESFARLAKARYFDSIEDTPLTSDDTNAENALTLQQDLSLLRRALNYLTPQQRVAITMGVLEDHKLVDIAKAMGVSESRACQLQKRALHNLQQWFAALTPANPLG